MTWLKGTKLDGRVFYIDRSQAIVTGDIDLDYIKQGYKVKITVPQWDEWVYFASIEEVDKLWN